MTLKEAIEIEKEHRNTEAFWDFTVNAAALNKLINHAEATRWRKLPEEPPTKPGECILRCAARDGSVYHRIELVYGFKPGEYFLSLFCGCTVTHWRPNVGPEEE